MSESPIRIGLVEDNPLDVKLFRLMLARPPEILYELHQCARLSEALELLENETFDVMLLDLSLPDCKGLEIFHQVKSRVPNLPIIIFSAQDEEDLAIQAVADGAQDYLVKGQTSAHMLKRAITYSIERQRAADEKLVRATFSAAATGIATAKSDGEFLLANPAYCKMMGYSDAELRALNLYTLLHPDDRRRNLELKEQLLTGKIDDFSVEERYLKKDGGFVWLRANVSLERSPDGRPLNIITVSEDISERKNYELALEKERNFFSTLLENISDGIVACDEQGMLSLFNRATREFHGLPEEPLPPEQWAEHYDLFLADGRTPMHTEQIPLFRAFQGEIIKNFEMVIAPKNLPHRVVVCDGRAILTASGQRSGAVVVLHDITERKQSELVRLESDKRIRDQAALLDKAQDAIIVHGLDHAIQFWNKGAERLYGWTSAEAVGISKEKLLHDDLDKFQEAVEAVMNFGEWSGEITQRRKDGTVVTVEAHWNLIKDDNDQPHSILSINTNISQRKAAEEKIEHLAFYDNLTGLANRLLLVDRLQQALVTSARNQHMGALLFIDLDNFKTLNDTLGHDMGDLLLQQVAHRLIGCVRESDTVARLGGDEFVVMVEDMSEIPHEAATQAKIVGEKIIASFNQPFQLEGYEHYSSPSIGVTLFNDQPNTVDELLKRADIAMYQAKLSGRNAMRFYDPEMQEVINARVTLEAELHEALQQSEFLLHYQPQINNEGQIIGAEALVRWQHPKLGLVPPAKFIPTTEDTGLILLLGHWVLETACTQLAIWATRPETAGLSLSVNVSTRQFRQPDFVEQVLAVIDYTGANPQRLKLELTESLLVDSVEDIIAKMVTLKAKGVGFSLDDFGTGYSSLAYLKRLPLAQLKIDQSFVKDVLTDPNDAAIARTIVALGQSLGMAVVAEGVETEEQRDFLAKQGCDVYQGYLFSRPLPIEQFEEYMLAKKRREKKLKSHMKLQKVI